MTSLIFTAFAALLATGADAKQVFGHGVPCQRCHIESGPCKGRTLMISWTCFAA